MQKILTLLVAVLLLSSCSSEEDPKPVVSADDYFPNTNGSSWSYTGVFSAEMAVTGNTKKFDGRVYSEIESTNDAGTSSSYLFKSKGVYRMRGFVAGVADLDLLILKDNVSEASTWEQSITINGVNTLFTYTLTDKNISEEVNQVVYDDVIIVRMEQSYEFLGMEYPLSTITFHFAKGIGIIKIETEYDSLTGLDYLNGITEISGYVIIS